MKHPVCPKCKNNNPDDFYKDNRRKGTGYQTYCKECAKGVRALWASQHRDKLLRKRRLAYKRLRNNPERWQEYLKEKALAYENKHLYDQVANANRRARKHKRPGRITIQDWREIVAATDLCSGCGKEWKYVGKPILEHIKPLKIGGRNFRNNIQACCKSCNLRKMLNIKRFKKGASE